MFTRWPESVHDPFGAELVHFVEHALDVGVVAAVAVTVAGDGPVVVVGAGAAAVTVRVTVWVTVRVTVTGGGKGTEQLTLNDWEVAVLVTAGLVVHVATTPVVAA
ncbi:hypothetical protein [Terrabacter terrae]|uniref:hypothetical protein n=1 Tax=Terrabacter terrae TaxID=318434 RepID=UPI0031D3DCB1